MLIVNTALKFVIEDIIYPTQSSFSPSAIVALPSYFCCSQGIEHWNVDLFLYDIRVQSTWTPLTGFSNAYSGSIFHAGNHSEFTHFPMDYYHIYDGTIMSATFVLLDGQL